MSCGARTVSYDWKAVVVDRQGEKNGLFLCLKIAEEIDPESPVKYEALQSF